MPIASHTSRDVDGGELSQPGSERPKRERYDTSVAHARSLLFSYIDGGHLPHHQLRRIEDALERLDRDHPEDAETLSRFHEREDKTDRDSEARAAKKLAECLSVGMRRTFARS